MERSLFAQAELRADRRDDGDGLPTLRGYAAVFNTLSVNLGGFREMIAPGAFATSVADGDVRAFYDHDSGKIMGRTASGTLTLEEDNRGLRMSCEPPDTATGREVVHLIERGDLTHMSFGFRVRRNDAGEPAADWAYDEQEEVMIRTLRDVELFEVSFVAFPAYPDTEASVRSDPATCDHAQQLLQQYQYTDIAVRHAHRRRSLQLLSLT